MFVIFNFLKFKISNNFLILQVIDECKVKNIENYSLLWIQSILLFISSRFESISNGKLRISKLVAKELLHYNSSTKIDEINNQLNPLNEFLSKSSLQFAIQFSPINDNPSSALDVESDFVISFTRQFPPQIYSKLLLKLLMD